MSVCAYKQEPTLTRTLESRGSDVGREGEGEEAEERGPSPTAANAGILSSPSLPLSHLGDPVGQSQDRMASSMFRLDSAGRTDKAGNDQHKFQKCQCRAYPLRPLQAGPLGDPCQSLPVPGFPLVVPCRLAGLVRWRMSGGATANIPQLADASGTKRRAPMGLAVNKDDQRMTSPACLPKSSYLRSIMQGKSLRPRVLLVLLGFYSVLVSL